MFVGCEPRVFVFVFFLSDKTSGECKVSEKKCRWSGPSESSKVLISQHSKGGTGIFHFLDVS